MTSLSTSTIQTFSTGWVSDAGEYAAVVLTVTIGLGIVIFLVFKGVKYLKGAL
jgi:hypothetical protein